MHIGLLAGIGPAATDFYYRGLIDRHVAGGLPLDLTMAHADVREMSRNLVGNNPKKQAEIFAGLAHRLKAAGAQAVAITSMGGHFCVNELMAVSPLPVLNAIPAVDAALARGRFRKIGILGTRTVMASKLYGGIPSVEVVPTEGAALERVHDNYVAMATIGKITEAQRQVFFDEGRKLCERGAEAIMLGGTDLFLAFAGHDPGFPVIDCADIHVDAIYQKSAA
jgi:aspartate racemase